MGEYLCDICKIYKDDISKEQFHCNDSEICRIGGREKFFHCKKCGNSQFDNGTPESESNSSYQRPYIVYRPSSERTQRQFSIVVESNGESPVLVPPTRPPQGSHGGKGNGSRGWIIVGSVAGGIALLVLLALCILWVWRLNKTNKMHKMNEAADAGDALHMTMAGNTKAPLATTATTQPTLQSEYIP